jgi:uncharacterized RDD family membrane protein YckC
MSGTYRTPGPLEHEGPQGATLAHRNGWFLGEKLATWPQRMASAAIDWLIPYLALHWWDLGVYLMVFVWFVNGVVMQSNTGQSLGKLILGIKVIVPVCDPNDVQTVYSTQPGFARLTARLFAHLIDAFFFIGVIRLGLNGRRESFADSVCNTLVIPVTSSFSRWEVMEGPPAR